MNHSTHAAIRAGDPVAFRELYQDHHRVVYAHAYRVTGDWTASEDVVSLTFLEAWRLRERLRDEGETPRPWLMGIAINVLRNRSRAARRHRHAMARSPAHTVVPDIADAVVTRIDDGERLAAARAALGRLRRTDREVFLLCVCSELTYAEAAHALGLPVGTVRSRLSRARVRLRALADEELRSVRAPFLPRVAIAARPAPVPTILREPTR
ncbi:RNA polymerase sigma factor (plasmid) [Embleya sp. NBC_00888]|uniref:RNA polymerase sigma factor n=1 Tax=Embleya sp. NBC_00888 TaxID=2975960 RepID=UPI002F919731|nr:RNA polymerase sigma factor [Embleya sp. NBC_00888]